jgi:uncharacterized protein DUF3105
MAVPNEGWAHVAEGSATSYRSNPPASGPHYPVWLRYREYAEPMARGYWGHNLEHGAVVVVSIGRTRRPRSSARSRTRSAPSPPIPRAAIRGRC